jgi:hypothetical protein
MFHNNIINNINNINNNNNNNNNNELNTILIQYLPSVPENLSSTSTYSYLYKITEKLHCKYPHKYLLYISNVSLIVFIISYITIGIYLFIKYHNLILSCSISHLSYYILTMLLWTFISKSTIYEIINYNTVTITMWILILYAIIEIYFAMWCISELNIFKYNTTESFNNTFVNYTNCHTLQESNIVSFCNVNIILHYSFCLIYILIVIKISCKE